LLFKLIDKCKSGRKLPIEQPALQKINMLHWPH
jgi:hypothetical protein